MPEWLLAVILGLIEGLTEFIPVSSTGHLLLAEQFLLVQLPAATHTFFESEVFNSVIQCGAVLAALPLFSNRLSTLTRLGDPANRSYFLKLILAFAITAAGALTLKKCGLTLPHTVAPIAIALIAGGVLFVLVEFLLRGRNGTSEVSWTLAVVFGLAQIIAVAFPGSSRSGCTIVFALIFGLSRGVATEFSFLLGVPTLCAAGAKTLFDALKHHETILWQPLAIATVVASIASILAVKWMLSFLRDHTLTSFGIYRITLGIGLLLLAREFAFD
jgi:undecaprenyl-diphosphatase